MNKCFYFIYTCIEIVSTFAHWDRFLCHAAFAARTCEGIWDSKCQLVKVFQRFLCELSTEISYF